MRVAIQASDLDHARIDGTRVYLKELLIRFGELSPETDFLLYHRDRFNPLLTPPQFPNYHERKLTSPYAWMQTAFAWELFRKKPEKLFLPIQAAPLLLPRNLEVTATIHDLAFKKFPETFPRKLLFKLNSLLEIVLGRADKLIAVSQATKDDILHYFPDIPAQRIRVIHHGFARDFYSQKVADSALEEFLKKQGLSRGTYLLYVGAIQPRKNLVRLIGAFERAKIAAPEMKLVIVGERAWLADKIFETARKSPVQRDILFVGQADFESLRMWYQGARLFTFPSLCEGFGIPILEAMASEIPVLTANNSSLSEVAGKAALYCNAESTEDMTEKILELWRDTDLQHQLVERGKEQLEKFSWDKCAAETLGWIFGELPKK